MIYRVFIVPCNVHSLEIDRFYRFSTDLSVFAIYTTILSSSSSSFFFFFFFVFYDHVENTSERFGRMYAFYSYTS